MKKPIKLTRIRSSAPDMYEALKAVARDLEGGKGVIFSYTENKVRQALAKAEKEYGIKKSIIRPKSHL